MQKIILVEVFSAEIAMNSVSLQGHRKKIKRLL